MAFESNVRLFMCIRILIRVFLLLSEHQGPVKSVI